METDPSTNDIFQGADVESASARVSVEPGVCASCRLPMIDCGPGGECLRCLVEFVFSPEGDDDRVGPDGDPSPSGRPPWRYGHFEILAGADGCPLELGCGAMGTTYRAYDTVLHTAVALKIIRQDLAASSEARARFLHEARAAARLHHPNVASVFHYGEQGDECFYAMELVEGETLEQRVQRVGPLPLATGWEIAIQVARALSAAEAHAMVHRDLKPSNIMLEAAKSPGGDDLFNVKVIDFGLARAVADHAGGMSAGIDHEGFAGTPAFASPEQFVRDPPGRIDTRSDIYSLGVTLWYLLTGLLPLREGTLSEIRARHHPGPSVLPVAQLKAACVPPDCAKLLVSMLAVAPEARPQTAGELYDALRRCQRRPRLHLLAGSVAILLTTIGVFAWRWPATPTSLADRSIAVLSFDDLRADAADRLFSAGARDGIIADLIHIADLNVVGAESARSYGPKRWDALKINRELGVRYLLEGEVQRRGSRALIKVSLLDTSHQAPPWTLQYDRPLADLFAVEGDISRTVAARLGARVTVQEREEIERPTTRDLAAYDLYLRAREAERAVFNTQSEAYRHYASVVPLLEEAIARDPNFALAYCELATLQDNLYHYRYSAPADQPAIDHRGKADAALAQARRLQPESGELHLAQATHFLRTSLENEQARIEVDLARKALPNDAKVEELAGEISRRTNHWKEAVLHLEKAVRLEPCEKVSRFTLANTYRLLRRYDESRDQLDQLIAILPENESATYRLFRQLVTLEQRADVNQFGAAIDEISRRQPGADVVGTYHLIQAFGARDTEKVAKVLAATDRAMFLIDGASYPREWFEALSSRMRGDQAGARAAFLAARAEVEKVVQANAGDGRMLGLLAMIDAGLGNREVALREAQRACEQWSPERMSTGAPVVAMNLAVVYAWTEQPELACRVIGERIGQPAGMNLPAQPTYGDLKLNPVWDPIRDQPDFIALIERLAPGRAR